MSESRARPIRIVYSMAFSFGTGSDPGWPRQTSHTRELGGAPNSFGQPQNILVAVESSTWHSSPTTVSNSSARCSAIPGPTIPGGGGRRADALLSFLDAETRRLDGRTVPQPERLARPDLVGPGCHLRGVGIDLPRHPVRDRDDPALPL